MGFIFSICLFLLLGLFSTFFDSGNMSPYVFTSIFASFGLVIGLVIDIYRWCCEHEIIEEDARKAAFYRLSRVYPGLLKEVEKAVDTILEYRTELSYSNFHPLIELSLKQQIM